MGKNYAINNVCKSGCTITSAQRLKSTGFLKKISSLNSALGSAQKN